MSVNYYTGHVNSGKLESSGLFFCLSVCPTYGLTPQLYGVCCGLS